MTLLLTFACTGAAPAPDGPPPAPDPAQNAAAPAPPSPAPAPLPVPSNGTHCTAEERVAFSCVTRDNKVLSVCAGPAADALQYRFGPIGAPELVFPSQPSVQPFTLGNVQFVRAEGMVLRFVNDGIKYEVTSLIGGGGSPEEGASNNFQGVYVYTARGKVVGVGCTGDAEDHLADLRASGVVPRLDDEM